MKSEHRHDLKTNELKKLTERAAEGFSEANYNAVLYPLCAGLIVLAGYIYWTRTSRATEEAAWADVSTASTVGHYETIATLREKSTAAPWARLREAQLYLSEGGPDLFKDRAAAVDKIEKAKKLFQGLVEERGLPGALRERALIGLAKSQEMLSAGDVSDALKTYETLVREFPGSPFKRDAETSISHLKAEGAKEFYAAFHAWKPKPADRARPADGLPDLPGLHGGGRSPLQIPDVLQTPRRSGEDGVDVPGPSLTPPETPEKPAGDEPEAPAKPETEPEKPEADKPAADKPETDKPEAEKPADPKPEEKSEPDSPKEAP